ncbi:MAG: MBL fold metallo-hydrolase [Bacteroidota bacterium]|nr:MBL fold metallo-hydrolase [Candidatus Kapabacteria bacterium]MCS7303351.1 MBL fold metallo-hydrolase [Candidatus Kapabacteria bacterium]MDW8075875.1 MBL fold metallo-hydrolase [Bacteroidota bacterium]
MFFRQIYEKGLAHASYMVGCQGSGTVAVIDPQRDIDVYLRIAEQEKLRITHVLETHIHADFLSGSRELQQVTGADLYLSDEGGPEWQYQFPHIGLRDGDTFMVGNIKFEVWHTPGHTPEHISFLVTDTSATSKPIMFFSGDFVFVGDVGRPDLLEKAAGYVGTMEKGARQLFASLQRFKQLPDYVQVHPAHGAGSACGKALGAIPHSTVGYEKLTNWALQFDDEEAFVRALLEGQPEPPRYFAMMKKLNKEPRPILPNGQVPVLKRLSGEEIEQLRADGVLIVDTRNKVAFAGGHIPGSINIQNNNSFSTWAGWIISYDKPFALVVSPEQVEDVTRKLIRIGLDHAVGYLADVAEWATNGRELAILPQMSVHELAERLQQGDVVVLDVRNQSEYDAMHLDGALHIFAGYLEQNLDRIPRDRTVAVHCAGGDRSSIATSLLHRYNLRNTVNVTGGINAWVAAGYPVVSATTTNVEA